MEDSITNNDLLPKYSKKVLKPPGGGGSLELKWDGKVQSKNFKGKKSDYPQKELKSEMKHILKQEINLKANENSKNKNENPKPLSKVFPEGNFIENSSHPYKYYPDLSKKAYFDKFSNLKSTIRDNQSLKVVESPCKQSSLNLIFGDNSNFSEKPKHFRVKSTISASLTNIFLGDDKTPYDLYKKK